MTRAAVLTVLWLVASTASAEVSKKDAYLAAKSPLRPVSATTRSVSTKRPAKTAAKTINLYNVWTHEWLPIHVAPSGQGLMPPTELLRRFLRCHFTDEITAMDERPMALALRAAYHFRADRIEVISGFRAPKYNLMLRKKGREVARDSQHTKGNAMDIRLPGVTPRVLARWAKAQHLGGVGIYKQSGFVHIDTGPIRSWTGR